jgi:hypothetical protein
MSVIDFLLGRPLKSSEETREKIGPAAGIAVLDWMRWVPRPTVQRQR